MFISMWLQTNTDYHNIVGECDCFWFAFIFGRSLPPNSFCGWRWLHLKFRICIYTLTLNQSSAFNIQHPIYPLYICYSVTFAVQIQHKIYYYCYYHFHLQLRFHSNATNIILSEQTHFEWWFLCWFFLLFLSSMVSHSSFETMDVFSLYSKSNSFLFINKHVIDFWPMESW